MLQELRSRTLIWTGPASIAGLKAAASVLRQAGAPEHGLLIVQHNDQGLRVKWTLDLSAEAEAEQEVS